MLSLVKILKVFRGTVCDKGPCASSNIKCSRTRHCLTCGSALAVRREFNVPPGVLSQLLKTISQNEQYEIKWSELN